MHKLATLESDDKENNDKEGVSKESRDKALIVTKLASAAKPRTYLIAVKAALAKVAAKAKSKDKGKGKA